jgi:hypothetical protein
MSAVVSFPAPIIPLMSIFIITGAVKEETSFCPSASGWMEKLFLLALEFINNDIAKIEPKMQIAAPKIEKKPFKRDLKELLKIDSLLDGKSIENLIE